jgi:tripartite-type tricarboxylate transporter receptor subunit TctC
MKPVRLQVLSCAVAIAALVGILGSASFAQMSYPDKPVRILVGFTPGSATDITARIFAQRFSEAWNVPVTVENVPGAGGTARPTGSRKRCRTAIRSPMRRTAR